MNFVKIWLKETSDPIVYQDVDNTYQKGAFYCLHHISRKATKFPIDNIWRIVEDHSDKPSALDLDS